MELAQMRGFWVGHNESRIFMIRISSTRWSEESLLSFCSYYVEITTFHSLQDATLEATHMFHPNAIKGNSRAGALGFEVKES